MLNGTYRIFFAGLLTTAAFSSPLTAAEVHSPAVVWSQDGTALVDHYGRTFVRAYSASALTKADATGKEVWRVSDDLFLESPCAFKRGLFSVLKGEVVAIDPTTGAQLWQHQDGDKRSERTKLYCDEPQHSIYALEDGQNQFDATILRLSPDHGGVIFAASGAFGKVLRITALGPIVSVQGRPSGNDQKSTLRLLDGETGRVLWSVEGNDHDLTFDSQGTPYLVKDHVLSRLDLATGRAVYTLTNVFPEVPWVTPTAIYLTSGDSNADQKALVKIDATNGRTLWRHDLPARSFIRTIVPLSDRVLMSAISWEQGGVETLQAIDNDGRQLWQIEAVGQPRLSSSGQLQMISASGVQQVNLQTGALGWHVDFAELNKPSNSNWPGRVKGDALLESQDALYVPYSLGGYHDDVGAGIYAIDQTTGAIKWHYVTTQHMEVVGQTSEAILVNEGLMGALVTKALAKDEKPAKID